MTDYTLYTDIDLWRLASNGDAGAEEELIERYVDDVDGSLVAGGCAQPAAVAFFFVDMDDLPNHIYTLLLWVFFAFASLL